MKDYCFHPNPSYMNSFSKMSDEINLGNYEYGTVNVTLTFFVDLKFYEKYNGTIIYSNFTGQDIGAQIRGNMCD